LEVSKDVRSPSFPVTTSRVKAGVAKLLRTRARTTAPNLTVIKLLVTPRPFKSCVAHFEFSCDVNVAKGISTPKSTAHTFRVRIAS